MPAEDTDTRVGALLREVAATIVMPRFGKLQASEIHEKTRGEVVTDADRDAEKVLHAGLVAIDPDTRVIGEEACEDAPDLLDGLCDGRVWVVDPIDGTSNFAAGKTPFGLMIALLEDGVTLASWLYDPVVGRMCHARRGGGAFIDDRSFRVTPANRHRPVAGLATQFMPATVAERLHVAAGHQYDLVPIPRCAAEHYPRVATGANDVALFQRTLPWDHLAGALFLTEAGGRVSRWDGSPYRAGDCGIGLMAATTPALWKQAMTVLKPGALGFTPA